MLEQPLLLTGAQGSSSLNHRSLPNKVIQDTLGTLPLTVKYFCNLRNAMPRHWSPSTSHPTLLREAGGFLMGGKYPEDVILPTVLASLQPVQSIFLD